jgi:2',3'-cyclic-nucleotide 2'-phosphodiesterase (5'-nucleotidase family)
VRRFFQITVSALAVAIILLGARYAYSLEAVKTVNLYERYQQINRESFDTKLPYVSVSWADLSAQNADGITSFDDNDHPVSIEMDGQRITSERDLRAVLRHAACHVAVGAKVAHGSAWQRCMDRFQD